MLSHRELASMCRWPVAQGAREDCRKCRCNPRHLASDGNVELISRLRPMSKHHVNRLPVPLSVGTRRALSMPRPEICNRSDTVEDFRRGYSPNRSYWLLCRLMTNRFLPVIQPIAGRSAALSASDSNDGFASASDRYCSDINRDFRRTGSACCALPEESFH